MIPSALLKLTEVNRDIANGRVGVPLCNHQHHLAGINKKHVFLDKL